MSSKRSKSSLHGNGVTPEKKQKVNKNKIVELVAIEDDECENTDSGAAANPEAVEVTRYCPYLDTINRSVLDFDFEKQCSISLSHLNVYACLICGKYFQGRGKNSHAHTHSVLQRHHVFLNLHTFKFYCLPDNYEIVDNSLKDIEYVLNPTFTRAEVRNMDAAMKMSRAHDGTTYYPGIVGLNNIKANDYCNVVLQALSNIPPLRNYFLREDNYAGVRRPPGDIMISVPRRFGELIRKLWNPRNFKAHVSPHEMLQAVVLCSRKKFQITQQGDSIEFMSWFLNALHIGLNGSPRKPNSSVIYSVFRGSLRCTSRKVLPLDIDDAERAQLLALPEYQERTEEQPFLYLTCDLPPAPLFKDEMEEHIIPQVPLHVVLSKFDGVAEKEYKTYKDSTVKRFCLTSLPPYLILCIKRFTKNNFFVEKNPTIVNFPISNIDMSELLADDPEVRMANPYTCYDLVANVVHEGDGKTGIYKVHVFQGSGKWYEMQDLHVTEILPQMITLSEAYIQIYKRINAVAPPAPARVPGDPEAPKPPGT